MNTGKVFENNFKASIPSDYYYLRLKDPAVGFCGGDSKYSPNNPFDCIVFHKYLFCFELKSKNGSMSIWKSSSDLDGVKRSYDIKKHQINGLLSASKYDGAYAGFIMNFRNVGRTVYVPVEKFMDFSNRTDKKSINFEDAILIGIEVDTKKLRVNERYNVSKLCEEVVRVAV